MKANDVFPSKYLKAEDFEEDTEMTIKEVVMETLKDRAGKPEEKAVCYFEGEAKGLIINKTNWAAIAKQHGEDSDDWPGKKIILTIESVAFQGDVVDAIRIKSPKKGGAKSWPGAVVTALIAEKHAKNSFEATAILGMSGLGPDVAAADAIEFAKIYRHFRDEGGLEPEAAADATKAKLAAL